MDETSYVWNEKNIDEIVIGYDKNRKAYDIVKNKKANAADDLTTTVKDYGQFLVNIMNGNLLSPKIFNEIKTKQVATKNGKYFGLGFEIYDLGNNEIVLSHSGADDGVRTQFFLLPKTKQGLIIFTNSDNGYKIYEPLIKKYLGDVGNKIIDIEMK